MKGIENKGIAATGALKNAVAGKATMSEVRRGVLTEVRTFMSYLSFWDSTMGNFESNKRIKDKKIKGGQLWDYLNQHGKA